MIRASVLKVALLVIVGAAPSSPTPAPPAPKPNAELSPLARQLLRRKMERHGDEMVRLVIATTLLQRDKVRLFAADIANEPRLTRPMPGEEDALNAGLPEKLFVLQDELRSRAKTLAAGAMSSSNDKLVGDLGLMLQTCVSCHAVFRPLEGASQ